MTFTRIKVQRVYDTRQHGYMRVAPSMHKPDHIFVEVPSRTFSLTHEQATQLINTIADYLEEDEEDAA